MKITHALICLSALFWTSTGLMARTHKENKSQEYRLIWKEDFRGKNYKTNSWSKIPRGESD